MLCGKIYFLFLDVIVYKSYVRSEILYSCEVCGWRENKIGMMRIRKEEMVRECVFS